MAESDNETILCIPHRQIAYLHKLFAIFDQNNISPIHIHTSRKQLQIFFRAEAAEIEITIPIKSTGKSRICLSASDFFSMLSKGLENTLEIHIHGRSVLILKSKHTIPIKSIKAPKRKYAREPLQAMPPLPASILRYSLQKLLFARNSHENDETGYGYFYLRAEKNRGVFYVKNRRITASIEQKLRTKAAIQVTLPLSFQKVLLENQVGQLLFSQTGKILTMQISTPEYQISIVAKTCDPACFEKQIAISPTVCLSRIPLVKLQTILKSYYAENIEYVFVRNANKCRGLSICCDVGQNSDTTILLRMKRAHFCFAIRTADLLGCLANGIHEGANTCTIRADIDNQKAYVSFPKSTFKAEIEILKTNRIYRRMIFPQDHEFYTIAPRIAEFPRVKLK